MNVVRALAKADQGYVFDRTVSLQKVFRLTHRDACGAVHGKTVGTRAYRGKGDVGNAMALCQREAVLVTACQ